MKKRKIVLGTIFAVIVFATIIGLTLYSNTVETITVAEDAKQIPIISRLDENGTSLSILATSNETEETVTTGVKGYYYVISEDSENSDFEVTEDTAYTEGTMNIDLSNNGKYIHMKAVDVAGNFSDPAVAKIEIMSQVSFILDGGTLNGDSDPEPREGLAGSTVDIGTPVKEGYKFTGWIPTEGTIDGTNYTYTLEEGSVTAQWEKDEFEYRVEYYYNGVINDDYTERFSAIFETVIEEDYEYEDKNLTGYKFKEVKNLPLTISARPENNVIKVYYVTDPDQTKELSYTVEYYKETTKTDTEILHQRVQYLQPDIVTVDKFRVNITDKYPGYRLMQLAINGEVVSELPEKINANDTIQVYYTIDENQTKELTYTVEYYKEGAKVESDTQIERKTVQVLQPETLAVDKDKINTVNKYYGYKLDKTVPTPIPDIVNNGDVIKVHYTIDESQTKQVSYSVEYYKDGLKQDDDTQVVTKTLQVLQPDELPVDKTQINRVNKYYGYKFERTNPEVLPNTTNDGSVIRVYYVTDNDLRKDLRYTVEYYKGENIVDDDTQVRTSNVQVLQPNTLNVNTDEINTVNKYYGYTLKELRLNDVAVDTLPVVVDTNDVIKVIYEIDNNQTKNLSYTVEYYKNGEKVNEDTQVETTTVQVLQPNTLTVNASSINITDKYVGYVLDRLEPTEIPNTIDDKGVIKVYYKKRTDLSYTINYLEKDTNNLLHASKLQGGQTFETVINAVDEIIPIDGYNYDSSDNASIVIGVEENVINLYYTKKNDLSYTVNYLEKDTNIELQDSKPVGNKTFGDIIKSSDEVISINGYNYDSADKETLTITTGENVINLYYTKRKDLIYKVNYLEENTNKVLHEQKVQGNQTFGTVIISANEAIAINGYNYAYPDNAELVIGTGENVINIYYNKVEGLSYTIKFLEKDTNIELHSPNVQGDQTFENVIKAVDEIIPIDGYNYNSADKEELIIGTGENIITLYYTKKNDLTYRVNYLEKDTNKVIAIQKFVDNQIFGTEINSVDEVISINGYKYDSVDKEILTIGTGENVINIYYTKRNNLTYIVNYLEKDTDKVLHEQKVGRNVVFDSSIKTEDEVISINGYDYDSADKEVLKITTGENVINIYYTKRSDLNYKVNYLEKDTNKVINTRKVVNNVIFGTIINSENEIIDITGYDYNSVDKEQLEIGTEENVINIYYTKRTNLSYTVNYLEKGTDRVLHDAKVQGNVTFETVIESINEIITINGFNFDSVDKNELIITTGENVINIYYTKRTDLSYKVNYLEKDTNNILKTQKVVNDVIFETVINSSDEVININGYNYDSVDKEQLTIGTSENIINIYYTKKKDLTYKINYVEKDTNKVLKEPKIATNITFGTIINSVNEVSYINGYTYDSSDKEEMTIGTDTNEMTLYYIKRTDLRYKVNYLEKDTGVVLKEQKVQGNVTFETVINSSDEVININGYNYDSADIEELTIGTGENVINLYYTKKTDLVYKVNYLEKDTNKVLKGQKVEGNQTFGNVIKASDEKIDIDGYNYSHTDNDEIIIGTNENVINLYYTKRTDLVYKVNYLEENTDKVLHDQKVVTGVTFETVIKSVDEAIEINGYNYAYPDRVELVIGTGENVINIYYNKVEGLNYKVNFLEKDTNKVLHSPNVQGNQVFENVIKTEDEIIEIDGYNYDSADKEELVIGTGENVINIYYTKRTDLSYKVNYLEKDTNKIISNQKVVNNVTFETEINGLYEVITIDGYNYDSVDKEILIVRTGENVINIYYTKRNNLTYRVNYLEKDTNKELHEQKIGRNVEFDSVIKSSDEVIQIPGYDYDSLDKEILRITTGENVINIYYTKKTDLNYKVNYLEKGTEKVLSTQKTVNNVTFEMVVNSVDHVININGYNYDSCDKETLTIGIDENVINIYYTKRSDLSYTVNYLEKDTNKVLKDAKVVNGVVFEDVITSNNEVVTIDGYNFDSADKEKLIIAVENNVINLYYTKKTDLSYTVNYLEKDTNAVLKDAKVVNGITFEAIIKSEDEVISIEGYNYDSADKEQLVISTSGNVINLYYTKKTDLSYTVNYLEKDTNKVLKDSKVVNNVTFGAIIESSNEVIQINGYVYNSVDKDELIIGVGENVINIYYSKRNDLSYKVNYLEKDTNRVLEKQKVVTEVTFESVIKAADEIINIDGFKYDSCDKETLTIGTEENVINIYYTKRTDLSYKVNYLEKDTNKILHDSKVQGNVTFEDVITSSDEVISINGYNYDSCDKETLTIGTEENLINIYYTKRTDLSYKVNYLEENTNNVIHEQRVVTGVTFETVIKSINEAISIDGYNFVHPDKEELVIGTEENVINLYYSKVEGLSYQVNFLEKGTDKVLITPNIQGNQVFGNVIKTKDEIIEINGYKYDSCDKEELVIGTDKNVINLYYTKRTDLSYKVNYLDKETNEAIKKQKVVENVTFETVIKAMDEIIAIDGYNYDSISTETLIIGTEENVINIYYTRRNNLNYQVNYLEKNTNKVIHPQAIIRNVKFGDTINTADEVIEINGYYYDSKDKEILEITTGENVINIYYVKRDDLSYKINYVEKNTNKVLNSPKVVNNVKFETVVRSTDEIIVINGYNYDSYDKAELVVGTDKNEITIYYTKRSDLSYQVNYLEKGTDVVLNQQKDVRGVAFGNVIKSSDEVIAIDGYNYDSADKEELIIGTDKNVINLYYTKRTDLKYTVNYLEKDTDRVIKDSKEVRHQIFGDTINAKKEIITIDGFKFDSIDKDELVITTSENVINIYYTKIEGLSYTVKYLEKDTDRVLHAPKTVGNQVFENIILAKDEIIEINGFDYDSVSKNKLVIGTGENEIIIYYTKRYDLSYTVKYIDKETKEEIHETKVAKNVGFETEVLSKGEIISIDGYNYDSVDKEKLIVGTGTNEIIIYYTKRSDLSYKVNYLEKYTNKVLHESKVAGNQKLQDVIVSADEIINIYGYNYDSCDKEKIVITTGQNVINIYYTIKDTKVTVHYYEEGTTNKVADDVLITGKVFDEYATNIATDVDSKYELVGIPENAKGTMSEEEIVVNYYYRKKDTKVIVHYYEEGTNNKLSENVMIKGQIDDAYTTSSATDIPSKYELVGIPENAKGTMAKETIEVTYYYRVKDTYLIVKYLEKGTNKELANPEKQTGKVEEDYITDSKTIDGYTLVGDSGNCEGKLTEKPITVIFYYLQNTSVKVNHIDKNTEKVLDSTVTAGLVGDKYTSSSKNFEGYVLVEKPSQETVTMTKGQIVLNYYYVHISAGVVEKHVDIVSGEILDNEIHTGNEGDAYDIPSKTFQEYDLVKEKLPTNSKGTMSVEPIEVIYYYKHRAKVIAEYIDRETGKKLINDVVYTGHETDSYTTERKEIKDYVLVEIPENADGEMTKEPITAKYYYAHVSAGVTVKHIDNITGEVLGESTIKGNEGDKYTTEPIIIPGYDIVREKLPDNSDGKMSIDETTVNYYYVKQSSVTIKYIDKVTGKEIAPSDEIKGHHGEVYDTDGKEIDGYDLVEVPTDKEGTMGADPKEIVYVYSKPGKVVVNYIDVDTNEKIVEKVEIPGHENDDYETNPKDIKYHELIKDKLPENDKGKIKPGTTEVNYYYRKLKFSLKLDKTIESVTLNGNTLPVNGDLGKVEIYRKDLTTAKVQIRYKITVTNDGELIGRAKLLEKIPTGTTMSKENNKGWEIIGTTATLETEDIKPGETKEYIVVLDWVSGETNIGTKSNTVDVVSTENEAGFDTDDTEIKGDSADLIITVGTGGQTYIVGATVLLVIFTGLSVVLVKKKTKKEE